MYGLRPRTLALTAAAAVLAAAVLPEQQTEASSNCLPGELKARLAQVQKKFGSVEVISTYRAGARMPGGKASYHASCRAVDFRPPSGRYSEVANWLKANHDGGVGTYGCGMNHIHIDNGPSIHFHHCQSADAGEAEGAARSAAAGWPDAAAKGVWPVVLPARAAAPGG